MIQRQKDFKSENNFVRVLIANRFYGMGFHLDMYPPIAIRDKWFCLMIDLIIIRFWWTKYKPTKIRH